MSMSKMAGGILLVAGTTIGAGMLALPVVTGLAGFIPTLALFAFFWLFMAFTALLFLEIILWMDGNANMITMAKNTLGKPGEIAAWIAYLFLLYALTTAYLAGSAPLMLDFIQEALGISLPSWTGSIPVLLLFGYFIFHGIHSVDTINRIMMVFLALIFIAIVVLLIPFVSTEKLGFQNWPALKLSIPFAATSFGFHVIIPSLTTLLDKNAQKIRKAIWIGSAIPLVVYILWEFLTLGSLCMEGPFGILEGFEKCTNGAILLAKGLQYPFLLILSQFFSFFAIITSFLGVSVSLADFLADGFSIQRTPKGKTLLCLLTFVPPMIFVLTDPRAFLSALDYAGAFGVMFLLGLLPVLMVWVGRYWQHRTSEYKVPGGKPALVVAFLFAASVLLYEIANKLG